MRFILEGDPQKRKFLYRSRLSTKRGSNSSGNSMTDGSNTPRRSEEVILNKLKAK